MKIYFAGSIRAGRDDQPVYEGIHRLLEAYGQVLTELVGSKSLTGAGEAFADRAIHDRDLGWLTDSDCIVAEVTTPSLGVGYEIGYGVSLSKPVLALYRPQAGKRLSAMIAGSSGVVLREYENLDQVEGYLREFFAA